MPDNIQKQDNMYLREIRANNPDPLSIAYNIRPQTFLCTKLLHLAMCDDELKAEDIPDSKDAWFRLLPSHEAHN